MQDLRGIQGSGDGIERSPVTMSVGESLLSFHAADCSNLTVRSHNGVPVFKSTVLPQLRSDTHVTKDSDTSAAEGMTPAQILNITEEEYASGKYKPFVSLMCFGTWKEEPESTWTELFPAKCKQMGFDPSGFIFQQDYTTV